MQHASVCLPTVALQVGLQRCRRGLPEYGNDSHEETEDSPAFCAHWTPAKEKASFAPQNFSCRYRVPMHDVRHWLASLYVAIKNAIAGGRGIGLPENRRANACPGRAASGFSI